MKKLKDISQGGSVDMRSRLDKDLVELNDLLLEMSMLIETAIKKAITLLTEKDEKIAQEVYNYEERTDIFEGIIQKHCLKVFVEQQPAAGDLRKVSSALKMITDMERIGDISRDIAELCMLLPEDYGNKFPKIREMAKATIDIVNNSINSFVNQDLEIAEKIESEDDIVDDYFSSIRDEFVDVIKSGLEPSYAIDFIMIAKYLERIADHAVNISEWVIFSIKG